MLPNFKPSPFFMLMAETLPIVTELSQHLYAPEPPYNSLLNLEINKFNAVFSFSSVHPLYCKAH